MADAKMAPATIANAVPTGPEDGTGSLTQAASAVAIFLTQTAGPDFDKYTAIEALRARTAVDPKDAGGPGIDTPQERDKLEKLASDLVAARLAGELKVAQQFPRSALAERWGDIIGPDGRLSQEELTNAVAAGKRRGLLPKELLEPATALALVDGWRQTLVLGVGATVLGALAGGAFAGPPGAITGGVIGAVGSAAILSIAHFTNRHKVRTGLENLDVGKLEEQGQALLKSAPRAVQLPRQ